MFGSIAARYDLANHILSAGCDFYWRRKASEIVATWKPVTVIDLATGTGDLALTIQRKLPDTDIIGADFTSEMLAVARRKGLRKTIVADALALPFGDESFDCLTIGFGLRNIEDWNAALREMGRVLRSGGHLVILEFSLPRSAILRTIYRFYLHRCLPVIGSFLTRKKSAYDYLGRSIEYFPSGDAMLALMKASGFDETRAEPLTGGIATIYTGRKCAAATA
jgi:demethylmenaquinone methyltransferase / 2-methoxy-6-polyprenyl-1,4-benzoquinol methylase